MMAIVVIKGFEKNGQRGDLASDIRGVVSDGVGINPDSIAVLVVADECSEVSVNIQGLFECSHSNEDAPSLFRRVASSIQEVIERYLGSDKAIAVRAYSMGCTMGV